MNQPVDYLARRAALDPLRSFAVSAPAGSGKTGLLTQRLLTLLSLCENPEEILAITFTRKAAGEMQDRVLQALWKAKEQSQPNNPHDLLTWELAQAVLEQDKIKGWNLLQCPQRLRVQTIDSLCSKISQQLPITNGFGGQPKPSDDTQSTYQKAVHQLLAELEMDSPIHGDLTRLLEHLDNNIQNLENLLIQLLAKRDQWLGLVFQAQHHSARQYLEAVLSDIIKDSLEKAHRVLQLHGSELALIVDWAATNLHDSPTDSVVKNLKGIDTLPKPELTELNTWLVITEFLLTSEGTFRKEKGLTKNQGFPPVKENKASPDYKKRFGELTLAINEQHNNAASILNELRSLPPSHYDNNQWELLESLTRLLPRLAAILDIVFAEQGETDFTAVSQAALKALGDEESPTEIALQLDYRIRHILVDEFQDTSSTQLQLLERLTAGWQADDGRSLFIVGDGMQSCYSFRNANVGIFLEARAQGIGNLPLEKIDLTVNFRSQTGVVNWVNEKFRRAFPVENDINRGAVSYSPSSAFKPALEGEAVELWLSGYHKTLNQEDNDDESVDDNKYLAELQEAEAVALLIKNLRERYPSDSIALLARGRNHLQNIFPAMSRMGLSWQATEIDSLAQRMAIIDLTSLTRALLNPADRIAWLAILRAPWCGLGLKDLHTLVNTKLKDTSNAERIFENSEPLYQSNLLSDVGVRKNSTQDFPAVWSQVLAFEKIPNLSLHAKKSLNRFINVIEPALRTRQRKPLRQSIEGIWLALGGPATLLDSHDINDIPNFFALLEQHQHGSNIKDWQTFYRAISKLFAAPHQNADVNLQVMTMHKSKGLEFDHVIIPRLHKLPPSDGPQLILWRERLNHNGNRQLLLGPLAPIGGEKDRLYAYLKKEAALQLEYESTRLFYVGCTRAIKKLYLFATLPQNEDGDWKTPPKKSLLNCIWESTQHQAKKIQAVQLPVRHQPLAFDRPGLQQLLRLKADWHPAELVDNTLLKKYRGKEFGEEENIPNLETRTAKLARHTGSLIHRVLQNLVNAPQDIATENWLRKHEPFCKLYLQKYGWSHDDIVLALQKITRAIRNTLNDNHGLWLLNSRHTQSACELSIIHQEGTSVDLRLRENIIDRTFIVDNVRWIIDYKSSEPAKGQTTDDFIAQEISAYTPQLIRYKACFVALGETTIKLALYFPLLESPTRLFEIDA